jgi:hypothetical protein
MGSGYHSNNEQHHEDFPTAQAISGIRYKDSDRFVLTILWNPFQEESTDIYKLDSKEVVKSSVGKISNLLETGSRQYDNRKSGLANKIGFMSQLKRTSFPFSVGMVMQV